MLMPRTDRPGVQTIAAPRSAGPEAPPSIEAGVIYAVGDIHGRADLLAILLDRIQQRDGILGPHILTVLFLGDYIDRGPQSQAVVDRVIALAREGWCKVVALKGNHEEIMLKFLAGASVGRDWIKLGGAATFRSYGVAAPHPDAIPPLYDAARTALARAVPPSHIDFMQALSLWSVSGDYVFVHAGVKPDVPLAEQRDRDLLWIRGEFARCDRPMDKVVVYGHTPNAKPKVEPWKIGLDTGAYGTGILTAMRLQGASREIIQAARHIG
jgi:serine/threonine protein phosphatase 1